jgi:hypothetical protein
VDAYRSLLINAAQPFRFSTGETAPVQSAGAGMLDLLRAMRSAIAVDPVSISFGAGSDRVEAGKELRLRNLSDGPVTVALTIDSTDSAKPQVEPAELEIKPRETASVKVRFAESGLQPGAYQGFIVVKPVEKKPESDGGEGEPPEEPGAETGAGERVDGRTAVKIVAGTEGEGEGEGEGEEDGSDPVVEPDPTPKPPAPEIRVPYWYGVRGTGPESLIVVRRNPSTARPSSTVRVYFRVHDRAGLPMAGIAPRVAPVSGGGIVRDLRSADSLYPGSWLAEIVTGPFAGPNVFQVEVDGRLFTFQITTSN